MRTLDAYYLQNESTPNVVGELANPELKFDAHRDQVNTLVLNLVIKYLAEYLEVQDKSVSEIRDRVMIALQATPQDAKELLLKVVAGLSGAQMPEAHESDLSAVQCVTDLRSTAAIVKEIIFNNRFSPYRRSGFVGVDLGSGTGILALASIIAALRKNVTDIGVFGMELSSRAVERSSRALGHIASQINHHGTIQCSISQADISRPDFIDIFDGLPISFWISETINQNTPAVDHETGQVIDRDSRVRFSMALVSQADPFSTILQNTQSRRPHFREDVLQGRTAMFPDTIHGLYRPGNESGVLRLSTSNSDDWMRLSNVGQEFNGFEDFGVAKRWLEESPEEEQRIQQELEKALKGIL